MKRTSLSRWWYDLGFSIFGIVSLPHFLGRLRQAEAPGRLLRERLGLFSRESLAALKGTRPLWIHGVSVGEVLACEKFIQLIREKNPDEIIILTTVTPTGQRMAKRWEDERLKVFYFPFDLHFAVRRFFEALKPSCLLLVETELWPNVIEEARSRKVPVGIVNGRISQRSFRSFRRFSFIFRPVFDAIDFFLLQTEKDRERLASLGVDRGRMKVTGNMKLDRLQGNGRPETSRAVLKEKWGFLSSDQILIGGSSHRGEEEILLRALCRLREEKFPLKLLLAPRHIERVEKVLEQSKKFGFETVLASAPSGTFQVLILDQLGPLRDLYPLADVVFMGGSLVRHGGQNPVEPAASRRAILHGPWVFNFEELYHRLDEAGAGLRVSGEEELVFVLKRLLGSEREKEELGTRAFEVLTKLQGASERNFNWIEEFVKKRDRDYGEIGKD